MKLIKKTVVLDSVALMLTALFVPARAAQPDYQGIVHQHFFNLRHGVQAKTRTMYSRKLEYFANQLLIDQGQVPHFQANFENLLFNDAQTMYVQMLNNFKQNNGFTIEQYFASRANPPIPYVEAH